MESPRKDIVVFHSIKIILVQALHAVSLKANLKSVIFYSDTELNILEFIKYFFFG